MKEYNMIQILYSYISHQNHTNLLDHFFPTMSNEFKIKTLKYRKWQDSQLHLLGRLLLKKGMADINVPFFEENLIYSPFNKPYFKDEKIKFNISHSGEIVVCVINKTFDTGIDIETIKKIKINEFKSQMTAFEWQRINSSNNIRDSFFDYWTQKEAVIKAQGMGLSIPLISFEVINFQTKINDDHYILKEVKLDPAYKCHIAFKCEIDPVISNPQLVDFVSKNV